MVTRGFYKWRSKSPGDGGQQLLTRRFLTSRLLLAPAALSLLRAQKAELSSFDFSLLDEGVVPAELFFVREHFPAPTASASNWRISIGGAVAAAFELSYDELSAQPRRTLPVTVECAENPVGGGLVSHAEWSGTELRAVIEKARPSPEGRFVRLSGADGFSRCIPLEKVVHADTVLALNMNGERLPASHGSPVRAVIPGWYGMDSVKWLRRIEVLAQEDTAQSYVRLTRSLLTGTRPSGPVTAMNVNSAFSRPLEGAILFGRRFLLRGAAWAGESRVRQVEVSLNGAKSWQTARLSAAPAPYAWTHWSLEWRIPGAGEYELAVRATDDQGRPQPAERASDRVDDYERNVIQTIRVTVA